MRFIPTIDLEPRIAPAAAAILRDVNPGVNSGLAQYLTEVNGIVYFRADNGTSGSELWKSDGTSAGTVMVKDINPGSGGSDIRRPINVNGTLYFVANDGTTGHELWKSDGTTAGTVLVRDIRSGSANGVTPGYSLTNVSGTIFFVANDGTLGPELWKSDGTSAGTFLVRDIWSGPGNSGPSQITNFKGQAFFRANDGTLGRLWKSDGTSAGTVAVSPTNITINYPMAEMNGVLYFGAGVTGLGHELWRTDGTSEGTVLVRELIAGSNSSYPNSLFNHQGTLYFSAIGPGVARELWKSDGTFQGTSLVADLVIAEAGSGAPLGMLDYHGRLVFSACSSGFGRELWAYDNATDTIELIKDIRPGLGDSNPTNPINVNGALYFFANDGVNGTELWRSFGTAATTQLVCDIVPGSGGGNPNNPVVLGGDKIVTPVTTAANGLEPWLITDLGAVNINLARTYANAAWTGLPAETLIADADPAAPGNQPALIGVNAFATLPAAMSGVLAGGTVVALPGTYAAPLTLRSGVSLHVPSGTVTVSGVVSGASLVKTGVGTLALTAANTFGPTLSIQRGTLAATTDAALGPAANTIAVGTLGTLAFTGNTTTARVLDLGNGVLNIPAGVTLSAFEAVIAGGSITGGGTIFLGGSLANTTIHTGVAVTLAVQSDFTQVTNHGSLVVSNSESATLTNYVNSPAGTITFQTGSTTTASGYTSSGQLTLNGTSKFNNTGPALTFAAGSITTLAAASKIDVGTAGTLVAGGLVKNSGTFGGTGTVTVDFNGRVQGAGTFGSVITQNGGVFAPGSSPGTATTNQLNINGGGTLEFEVTDASGTAGNVSGWDLVNVQPTSFSPSGLMNYTATPGSKYLIQLKSRLDDGIGNTPGAIDNFNGSLSYAWKFADGSNVSTASSGTFDPNQFQIDTTGFSNSFTGGFSVELRDGGKNLYVVYTPVAGPTVTNLAINEGAAQRSRVTRLDVTLSSATTLGVLGAIAVSKPGTTVDTSNGLQVSLTGNLLTLTFANVLNSGVQFGSLVDGRWRVTLAGIGYTSPEFHRIFGDVNGDATVDGGTDFAAFAIGNIGPSNAPFDFNADGTIDGGTDFAEFGSRFGRTV